MTTPDRAYYPEATPTKPCVVCAGAGHWDEMTGAPVYSLPPPPMSRRCPYCLGTGKANVPKEGTFR
jgi:hypothetical protein